MKDKSQLDDMRAALRGDLERARERRGATLLDPEPESRRSPSADVSDTPEEAPEVVVQVADARARAEPRSGADAAEAPVPLVPATS